LKASEKKPEIRCGIVQNGIKALDSLDPVIRERILKQLPSATLQSVNNAKTDAWLPVEFDIQLYDCIANELTEKEYFNFCITANKLSIKSSTIGPIIRSALNLFRVSPKTLLRFIPQIWNSCYRNCGEISIAENGKNCLLVVVNGLPLEIVGNKSYLMSIAAFINAMDEFTEANRTNVKLKEQSQTNRSIVFDVSWRLG
jgi:hypothetical protein